MVKVIGLKPFKQAKRPLTDLAAYPILTEEVGFPPSPLASQPTTAPGGTPGGGSLSQISAKAISDVLGWKGKPGDVKGFIGALTQSFTISDVEGHMQSTWMPRSYAVQTDLAGGITGAQASVYARAKAALDSSLPLLDGLYALDPEAVQEDVTALKAVVKGQFSELVGEIGFLGGPRIQRANEYFRLLLGPQTYPSRPTAGQSLTVTDPDQIKGTLGNLRDELGLSFVRQDFVNSIVDETNLSNFRIISDYVTSLAQSWINNLAYVGLDSKSPFFGTQLVLLSRQLQVVAETVDEVRFTLDSVFIGPAERQTVELDFADPTHHPMFLEDLLSWTRNFASEEGPRLIQDGGKFGVGNTFFPVVSRLQTLVSAAPNSSSLPQGFSAPRVTLAFKDLVQRLQDLAGLAKPIKHIITPEPNFGLPFRVSGVEPTLLSINSMSSGITPTQIFITGNGFQNGATVSFTPTPSQIPPPLALPVPVPTFFRSENCLAVLVAVGSNPPANPPGVYTVLSRATVGSWDLQVTNSDGTISPLLRSALVIEP
jgi:hypothetical protein